MKDESDEDEATTLVTCVNKNDTWTIDSGCSHHMIGDSVRFGNDAPCLIKGKGSIKLTEKISYDNAYYVEGLNYNLLNVSKLGNVGWKVDFGKKRSQNL